VYSEGVEVNQIAKKDKNPPSSSVECKQERGTEVRTVVGVKQEKPGRLAMGSSTA